MGKQKTSGLRNWNPSKGNPHDYQISNYKDTIAEDTKWEIAKTPDKGEAIKNISFGHNLKKISSMDLKHTELLSGLSDNDLLFYFDKEYLDCSKEITVWLDYPFGENVKATIYPLVRTFTESDKSILLEHAGYLLWQIAGVYAEIYQNHWESIKVWGHGFEDLYLEGIVIYKDNVVELMIGS